MGGILTGLLLISLGFFVKLASSSSSHNLFSYFPRHCILHITLPSRESVMYATVDIISSYTSIISKGNENSFVFKMEGKEYGRDLRIENPRYFWKCRPRCLPRRR